MTKANISALPLWAQTIIKDLEHKVSDLRDERDGCEQAIDNLEGIIERLCKEQVESHGVAIDSEPTTP